jgi:methylisocitrate lyase
MAENMTAGARFRKALAENKPLQIVGTVNAYNAMMATRVGHQAIYLSGGGVANASYGLPDLGMTTMNDVLEDVRRITSAVEIVSLEEMVDRIKAAVDARTDDHFFIMARTDAFQMEGLNAAVERAQACLEAGADGIFAEAVHTLDDYRAFSNGIEGAHLLANITEFGATPLFNKQELGEAGATMVLYPLSAFRAANKAALNVYQHLLEDGDQKAVVDTMQTRMELYDFLNYHDFEQKLDALFAQGKNK